MRFIKRRKSTSTFEQAKTSSVYSLFQGDKGQVFGRQHIWAQQQEEFTPSHPQIDPTDRRWKPQYLPLFLAYLPSDIFSYFNHRILVIVCVKGNDFFLREGGGGKGEGMDRNYYCYHIYGHFKAFQRIMKMKLLKNKMISLHKIRIR